MQFLHPIGRRSPTLFLGLMLTASGLPSLSAGIKVIPPALDFGERGHKESPRKTVELVNEFPVPIRIPRVKPSCSCIKVSPTRISGTLDPGAVATLTVTMSSGRAFGRLRKHIEVDVSGNAKAIGRLRVPVSMSVFANYALEPRELRFEGRFGGSPVTQSVLLRSKKKRPGKRLDLEFVRIRGRSGRLSSIGTFFKVRISDHPEGATIAATLSPRHPEGRIWGELEARLEGKPLVVPLAGDMFRGILLSPKYFNFNRVETRYQATHVEKTVIQAIDGHAFEILSMTARITRPAAPGFSVELESDSRKDGLEHTIRARLVEVDGFPVGGSFSGKVSVKTDHPLKPTLELGFFGFFPKPKG